MRKCREINRVSGVDVKVYQEGPELVAYFTFLKDGEDKCRIRFNRAQMESLKSLADRTLDVMAENSGDSGYRVIE